MIFFQSLSPSVVDEFNLSDLDVYDFDELQDVVDMGLLDSEDFTEADREEVMARLNMTDAEFETFHKRRITMSLVQRMPSDTALRSLNRGTTSSLHTAIFTTRRDDKVCPICEDLDGEEFDVNPVTKLIDGPTIPDDLHPNCRCRYLAPDDFGDEEL